MSAWLVMVLVGVSPQAEPDTAVICPAIFRQAMEPWLDYRRQQGHAMVLLSNRGSAEEVRQRIRQVAQGGRLRFVVLVGDAEPGSEQSPALAARCVPVHRARAEVTVLWGSEPHIAADSYYADLDDDQVPELAVGRLSADSPEELAQIVAKVVDYEQSSDFGPWRRRLSFVAGVGGFNPLADSVLESTTRHFLAQGIPPEHQLSMSYGNWRSPYCPDPRQFHQTTLDRLNEGSWFWVYIGHGHPFALDRVYAPTGQYPILAASDVPKLRCGHGAPIALFLSCYAGAFDATADCLAERMVRQPGGPVAVLAASRLAMPYAMAVLATGLMQECFQQRTPTLGEAILHAKQKMVAEPTEGDQQRAMLDTLAKAVSPAPDKLAAERYEHLLLMNLIGDPLLRLRYPQTAEVKVPAAVVAGEAVEVAGRSPVDGQATIELVVPHGALTFTAGSRTMAPHGPVELAAFQDVYGRANDPRLDAVDVPVERGQFLARLRVPPDAHGMCYVRAFVEGFDDFAMGAAEVKIETSAQAARSGPSRQ